jgi:hypothetical protein
MRMLILTVFVSSLLRPEVLDLIQWSQLYESLHPSPRQRRYSHYKP